MGARSSPPAFTQSLTHYDNPEVEVSEPNAVAVDSSGNIWVAQGGRNHVLEFNSEHKFLRQLGETGEGVGQFKGIGGIAANSSGDIWPTSPTRATTACRSSARPQNT